MTLFLYSSLYYHILLFDASDKLNHLPIKGTVTSMDSSTGKHQVTATLPMGSYGNILLLANSRKMVDAALAHPTTPLVEGMLRNNVVELFQMTIAGKWNADTSSPTYVGGIAGICAENQGSVSNCSNSGTISGFASTAGIVGKNMSAGTILRSSNSGSIICTGTQAGGIAGINSGQMSGCSHTGNINMTGMDTAGGICGENDGSNATISGCINTAKVDGVNKVGGILGHNATGKVIACYNIGEVTGGDISAVVTYRTGGSTVTDCYFGGAAAGMTVLAGTLQFGDGVVADTGWPDSSMIECGFAPTGPWANLGSWNGGVGVEYPTLAPPFIR